MAFIFKGSDHNVKVDKVRDAETKVFLNNGTCTYWLYKKIDMSLLSTGDVPYVASSNGKYFTVIDRSVTENIVVGEMYLLQIFFEHGQYDKEEWRELLGALEGIEQ